MKAFWWFKENSIAGMARPGFNLVRLADLNFEESVLLGWLGQYSSGHAELKTFRHHLNTYVPKIYRYHKHDDVTGPRALLVLNNTQGISDALERLNKKLNIFKSFTVSEAGIDFVLNEDRLNEEISFLKKNEIRNVVSLTEQHHQKEHLQTHFTTHHISIPDLSAPTVTQVHQLADIFKTALSKNERLAIHCLAGIGRTSTMILAAHMVMGEKFEDLETRITRQNPAFALTNPQIEFLNSLK